MKAMILIKHDNINNNPLKLVDVPTPKPKPNEIRIKVSHCGICRTDLHVIEGELPTAKLPIIPGHQIVGIVDECGTEAKRFQIGMQVGIAWLRKTCQICRYCKSGKENLCEKTEFTGYHKNGGFAEYAVVHEDYAYLIPSIFMSDQAAPLLCAGIIGYRALQRSQLPSPGGNLGIYGFGSSAHIVIQLALQRGCKIYVLTRDKKHQQLAAQLGASWVGSLSDQAKVKFDSAIIFAPAGNLVPLALEALEKGGTLSLAGIYMSDIPSLIYEKHLFYEKKILSVTANTREDGNEFLKEAAQIPIHPNVTKFPLEKTNEALQALKNDAIQGSGVITIA